MQQGINVSRKDAQKIFPDGYLDLEDPTINAGLTLYKNHDYWDLIDGWRFKMYIITDKEDMRILTELGY